MGVENLNIFIAFVAGLVSFVSPCVLPLVPSYISFIGGQGLSELKENSSGKMSLLIKTLFFVLGFTIVFILLGILLSGTAAAFSGANRIINIVAGLIVLIFGLNLIFNFISVLNYEKRFHLSSRPAGVAGSTVLGMAFAAGWSPCIGPILASILALAASGSSVSGGALLLGSYSLGLAMPFILTSLFLSRAEEVMKRIKPHMIKIQRVSGVLLVAIGILMIFGQYAQITNWLIRASFRLRSWYQTNQLTGRVLFSIIFIGFSALAAIPLFRRGKKGDWNISAGLITQLVFVMLLLVPGILQAFGLIDLPILLAGWLSFQGI